MAPLDLERDVARGAVIAGLFGDQGARRRLGRYALERLLGEGAHGVVFEGRDLELDRPVAVKVVELVNGDALAFVERQRAEARALASMSHPNVIEVFDTGFEGSSVYIVMELFEGNLESWLETSRTEDATLEVFQRAGRGLAAVHRAGLVHRDFKPSNVLLGSGEVKVADFGLAREVLPTISTGGSSSMTQQVGTPLYMAPEQHRGSTVDARADQFAFCVALWEALLGRRPFEADDLETLLRLKKAGPPATSELPRCIEQSLRRGLAFDPRDRFSNMDALLEALARDRGGRMRVGVGVGAGVLLVATASLVWFEGPRPTAHPLQPRLGAAVETRVRWGELRATRSSAQRTPSADALADIDRVLASADDGRHPDLVAELLLWRSQTLFDLGHIEDAVATLERSHFLALESAREDLAVRAALDLSYHHVANLHDAHRSRIWLDTAAALMEREAPSTELRSRYLASLGAQQLEAVSPTAGLATIRQAVALCEMPQNCSSAFTTALLGNFGDALARTEDFDEAVEPLQRALDQTETQRGPDHLTTAVARGRLGSALLGRGDVDAAERHYARAAATFDAQVGPEHQTAAVVVSGLAQIAQARGDLDAARTHYEKALPGLGPTQRAAVLNNLGVMALQAGELDEAIEMYQRAVDAHVLAIGRDDPELGIVLIGLGYALLQRDRPGDAIGVLEDAVRIAERRDATGGRRRGDARMWLAEALLAAERDRTRAQSLARAAAIDFDTAGLEERATEARALLQRIDDAGFE